MQHRIEIALQLAVFLVAGGLAAPAASSQTGAPPSLREQLEAQYELTKMNGDTVVPGTVLVIQKEGVIGVPRSNPRTPVVKYTGGALRAPSAPVLAQFGKDTQPLPKGEKVYVTKITVSLIEDWVRLQIVQCGACNATSPAGTYSSVVGFQFAKGSLKKASVPDVEDTIAQVFDIYTPPATPPPPPPKPPAPVVTVSEPLAKSLQEKLSSIGRVSWSATTTFTSTTGRGKHTKEMTHTNTTQSWEEILQVTINPRTCDMKVTRNSSTGGSTHTLFLEEAESVQVLSFEELLRGRLQNPSLQQMNYQLRITPLLYDVVPSGAGYIDFKVPDAQTGNQIAGELRQLAQQCGAIPIPPPAPNSGPSLADTMHFIEEKLNDNGAVNYTSTAIQTSDGSAGLTSSQSAITTQAAADPSTCLLSYHEKLSNMPDLPVVMSLRRVQKLEVAAHKDIGESAQFTYRIEPMVFGLYVTFSDGTSKEILFREEEMANRVAKAMNHAVELCGTFGNASTGPEPF